MLPVRVPTQDVNSQAAIVVRWYADDRSTVAEGDVLVEVETSKAVIEVTSPHSGVLLRGAGAGAGAQVSLADPVAHVFPDSVALEEHLAQQAAAPVPGPGDEDSTWVSAKARTRALELGVDLGTMPSGALITVRDVERAAARRTPPAVAQQAREGRPGARRLLLLGAGRGAEVVLGMLTGDVAVDAVAALDDDPAKLGGHVAGVPVVGSLADLGDVVASGAVDAAVVCIASTVEMRAGLRAACRAVGLPLANVVDPTARIAPGVLLGEGNVIGAFCFIGAGSRIGDGNNFSAYTSFDHHNVLGSDISTGPGCTTSGGVTVGNGVRMGTGVRVEPHLTLGDGVQVASGAVVLTSVPAGHAVKTRVFTTTVVPLRAAGA